LLFVKIRYTWLLSSVAITFEVRQRRRYGI